MQGGVIQNGFQGTVKRSNNTYNKEQCQTLNLNNTICPRRSTETEKRHKIYKRVTALTIPKTTEN